MTQKKKRVELFKLTFNAENDLQEQMSFFDFFANYLNETTTNDPWKKTFLKILFNSTDYFIFGMTTTKLSGIPCKNDFVNHSTSPLLLSDTEGLGYFNIALYDKIHKVLLFEFVLNGCWIEQFLNIVRGYSLNGDCQYNITTSAYPVLRLESYERLIRYSRYSQLELKIASPNQLILSRADEFDSISNAVELGLQSNADTMDLVLRVDSRKSDSSLNIDFLRRNIEWFRRLLAGPQSQHFMKIKFSGFYLEAESEIDNSARKDSIDLVNDKFVRYFSINEPRVRTDLQIEEKQAGILEVYGRCISEIRLLFRENL